MIASSSISVSSILYRSRICNLALWILYLGTMIFLNSLISWMEKILSPYMLWFCQGVCIGLRNAMLKLRSLNEFLQIGSTGDLIPIVAISYLLRAIISAPVQVLLILSCSKIVRYLRQTLRTSESQPYFIWSLILELQLQVILLEFLVMQESFNIENTTTAIIKREDVSLSRPEEVGIYAYLV